MAARVRVLSPAMASIRERDRSYRVEWRRGGRGGKSQSVTMPTLALAETAKQLAESRRHLITDTEVYAAVLGQDGSAEDLACPTVDEFVRKWLGGKLDISVDTLAEYRWLLNSRVLPVIGDVRVSSVDRDTVKKVIARAAQDGLAPATLRKLHVVLGQVLRTAVPRWLPENPCNKAPGQRSNGLPKIKRHQAVFLTQAEADLILLHCPAQIRDLIAVAFGTGLRLGELLALRVGDVELDGDTPVMHVQWARKKSGEVGDPKSDAGNRPVALTASLVEILKPRVAGRAPHALVFLSPAGKMWDPKNLRGRYWRRAIIAAARCPLHPPAAAGRPLNPGEEAGELCSDHGGVRSDRKPCGQVLLEGMTRCRAHMGIDPEAVSDCECPTRLHVNPRLHDTRHSHVDWLMDAEWDLFDIQVRIGHESVKTTADMYGNRRRKANQVRLDALDRILPRPRQSVA